MPKQFQMIIGSIIKILVTLTGLLLTFWFLIAGLIKKDKSKFKKGGIAFISTFIFLILFSVGEFAILPKDKKKAETVLIAVREASLGGIKLNLYKDMTYDLGTLGNSRWTGTYLIKRDTIILSSSDSLVTSFVMDEQTLLEIKNKWTKINFLEIQENKLK